MYMTPKSRRGRKSSQRTRSVADYPTPPVTASRRLQSSLDSPQMVTQETLSEPPPYNIQGSLHQNLAIEPPPGNDGNSCSSNSFLPLGASSEHYCSTSHPQQTLGWAYPSTPDYFARSSEDGHEISASHDLDRYQTNDPPTSVSPQHLELSNFTWVEPMLTPQTNLNGAWAAHKPLDGRSSSHESAQLMPIGPRSSGPPDEWPKNLKFESDTSSTASFSKSASVEDEEVKALALAPRRRQFTDPRDTEFVCHRCNRGFKRSHNLRNHNKTHDPNRVKDFVCTFGSCGMAFDRRPDVKRHHITVHVKAKAFACSLCPQRFDRKDSLQRHTLQGCSKRATIPKREEPSVANFEQLYRSAHGDTITNYDFGYGALQFPLPAMPSAVTRFPYHLTHLESDRSTVESRDSDYSNWTERDLGNAGEGARGIWRNQEAANSSDGSGSPLTSASGETPSHNPATDYGRVEDGFDYGFQQLLWLPPT